MTYENAKSLTCRRGWTALGACLLSVGGLFAQQPEKRGDSAGPDHVITTYGEFSIEVKPVAAIHGGPILVKITYRYDGSADKLEVELPPLSSGPKFDVPDGWTNRATGPALVSGAPGTNHYLPGANKALTDYFAPHQRFEGIKEGAYELTFRWHVRLTDSKKTEIAVPKQTVKLNIRKPTKDSLEEVRTAILKDVETPDAKVAAARSGWPVTAVAREEQEARERRAEAIARALDDANDPLVLRLRFDLLDDPRMPTPACSRLAFGMWMRGEREKVSEEARRNLVDAACEYLSRPYPRHGAWVVYYLDSKLTSRSFAEAIKLRLEHLHPLVRAVCFESFPEVFGEKQREKLLADLSNLHPVPEPTAVQSQIKRLDADSFRDREAAMAELRKMGVPVLNGLIAEQAKPRSAESGARIKQLAEDIKKNDRPENLPLEVETLKHLKNAKNERAEAALEAIANNKGDAWIVREARSIQGQRK